MIKPTILTVATTVPAHQHEQMTLHDRWLQPLINSPRAKPIFAAAEIDTRHSVFADADFLNDTPTTEQRNRLFFKSARPLAKPLIAKALAQANLEPSDIDHFIMVSCTGIDTPGLELMMAAELGMASTLRRTALIGMGCHAGVTALDRAMLELAARPDSQVLILAVELCTLHFQAGRKLENMIAGAIFGDGLAAAIVGASAAKTAVGQIAYMPTPRLLATMTYHDYQAQNLMGVHLSDSGFQIGLSSKVAKRLPSIVPQVVADFLHQVGLPQSAIRFWGIHPGGAQIINYVGQSLNLAEADLVYARQVLRRYGNMSSATIFFVLHEIMHHGHPQPDDYALLMAFGPGLTVELCLVQF